MACLRACGESCEGAFEVGDVDGPVLVQGPFDVGEEEVGVRGVAAGVVGVAWALVDVGGVVGGLVGEEGGDWVVVGGLGEEESCYCPGRLVSGVCGAEEDVVCL